MRLGLPRRHARLLRRSRAFRLLFFATLGSSLGTRLAVVALIVDVYDRTDSGKWVGALLVADFLPTIAIGLLLASLVDRLPRRSLMIGADVLRLAAFCALAFAGSATQIVALAAVVGFANGFFRPAVYAGLPNLVGEDELADANGLLQTIDNLAWMIGPLIGGVVLAGTGPDAAYWVNAATFGLSALLIAGIPNRLLQSERALSEGHWRDLAEGFHLTRRSRPLLTVLVVWSLVMLMIANVDVAEVKLAKVSLDGGNFGLGLMMGAAGFGLVLGSLMAGSLSERRSAATIYVGSIALMALGVLAGAISPNVWVASGCLIGFGIGNGLALVANSLLVQRGAPDHLRGRAFTLIMSVNYAAMLAGMIVAGLLADAVGARWTWGVAAAVGGLAALVGAVLARGVSTQPVGGVAQPAPLETGVSSAPARGVRAAAD